MTDDIPEPIKAYIDERFSELEEDQDAKRFIVEVCLTDAVSLAFGQLIVKGICSASEIDQLFAKFENGIQQEYKGNSDEEKFIRECGLRIFRQLRVRASEAALGKYLGRFGNTANRH